jgi:hypothetical protein
MMRSPKFRPYRDLFEETPHAARSVATPATGRVAASRRLREFPNNNPFGNGHREKSSGHDKQKPVELISQIVFVSNLATA